jgi:hypothetical protein
MVGGRQQCRLFFAQHTRWFHELSERTIDIEKREEGAWVKDPPEWPGLELKVRGAGNRTGQVAAEARNAVPQADRRHFVRKIACASREFAARYRCSTGAASSDDGNPEPFTNYPPGVFDRRAMPFVYAVMWAANTVAEQRQDEIEDDAKN